MPHPFRILRGVGGRLKMSSKQKDKEVSLLQVGVERLV
jgi:hypothetical protein